MPVEYADIILAVAALIAAALYLRTRRRRKKKSAPPVRPAAPTNQTAGVAATWAPPTPARPAMTPVAPTIVSPPNSGWAAAASASGLADLGCAAAGATCRRGPDMGLADAGATARLGPCAFVGRTGRAAARVAPGRRAGSVMGSPPGSSPILGRAAGWGSRRTSRPLGPVVEPARRPGPARP